MITEADRARITAAIRDVEARTAGEVFCVPQPPASVEVALCAARRVMWESHAAVGSRNNVAIRLASAFRLAGYTQPETHALLLQWNQRRRIDLPERELRAVAQSAYARPYAYAYGCHDEVIRSVCPYVGRLNECADYREQHPRSGRTL